MSEEDTRTRILNAAGAAFAEHGYEGTTIRAICRRAGVNLAAVNYHFESKKRLYQEVMRYAYQFRAEQTPIPRWPSGTPANVRLRDFVWTMVQRLLVAKELPWQARLMTREMLNPSDACRKLAEECFRPHFELLVDILRDLIPNKPPLPKLHQLAFAIISQCLFYKFNAEIIAMLLPREERESHFRPEQIAEFVTNLVLAAVGFEPLFAERRSRKRKTVTLQKTGRTR